MTLRISTAFACWLTVASFASAQPRNVAVSGSTRLDWEFVARRFGRDLADVPDNYDSKKQRYRLFIPAGYSKSRAWPLIVFISPSNDPVGWPSFEATCEREGIFFCSPCKAGNKTPGGLRSRIVLDATDDVRRRFRIDPDQTYIGGFSGGGRMACTLGFSMPEVFAGIIPVCGTNPPGGLTYLRHRLVDRVSVAFVTGEQDFNRRENEEWMAPYLQELDVRSKLWIVPGMGHDMPGPAVMDGVVSWIAADVRRRRDDAAARPKLNLQPDEAFRDEGLAERLLEAARSELKEDGRVWNGVAILHAIGNRWPKSEAAREAKEISEKLLANERLGAKLGQLRLDDDRKFFGSQARGLEKYGLIPKAIEAWEFLARQYPETQVADEAETEIRRLRNLKLPQSVPDKGATRARGSAGKDR